jgi:hypothetical protein
MKNSSTIFLQGVLALIGILALVIMIRVPLTEGRASNLDLFSIYTDPFILYVYMASIPFFIALFKSFKLLGYLRENKAFTQNSIKDLSSIRYWALILSIFIVIAGIYIRIFHHRDDDPAGFLAMCFVATIASLVVATITTVFEKILRNGIDMKSEYEKLYEQLKYQLKD